jgi:hypothetical protein
MERGKGQVMWKGEDIGSKTTPGFALDYHIKDCIVVTKSRRSQDMVHRAPGYNQVQQAQALMVHTRGRALNG